MSSTPPTASHTDLRGWLQHLSDTGRLAVLRPEVPLRHRLAAIAKRLDGRQAAYFPRAGGHDMPVVAGFMSRRAWIAEALGVPQSELLARFRDAAAHPLRCRRIHNGRGEQRKVRTALNGIVRASLFPSSRDPL